MAEIDQRVREHLAPKDEEEVAAAETVDADDLPITLD